MKAKGLTYLRGDCSPKVTPKSGHPWRKPVFPWAQNAGRYRLDPQAIDTRCEEQLRAAKARRKAVR